jgi:hypothetical protein
MTEEWTRSTTLRMNMCGKLSGFAAIEYWSRIWIMQEFVLAREILIMYETDALIPSALTQTR